jgi:hypothetical protein
MSMFFKKLIFSAMIVLVPFVLQSVQAGAADVSYPQRAYSDAELANVRTWEQTWVGKKVDKTNVDQVAEFLPESYVGLYKDPTTWGGPEEGIYFYVIPYTPIVETPGMIEATKKYAPLVQTQPDGTIANYGDIAGIPYPEPKTGLEIAWNFDFNNHGDSAVYSRNSPSINPRQRTERYGEQEQSEFWFVARTEVDPKPVLPNNPRGYRRGIFIHMYGPPEFINTRYYSMRFIDPAKDDEMFMWYSQFRRIRRMSTAQRSDAVDGTDLIYDDEFFWDGHIMRNTYEFKGRKELLCARQQDMSTVVRQKGQALPSNLKLERLNTLVVEAVSKDPNYAYGKRVWYVCPETYYIMWTEIYDNIGRFWKSFMMFTNSMETATGATKNVIVGYALNDFQRVHSGYNIQEFKGISIDINPNIFTISNLQQTY